MDGHDLKFEHDYEQWTGLSKALPEGKRGQMEEHSLKSFGFRCRTAGNAVVMMKNKGRKFEGKLITGEHLTDYG
jgi:hypothetical protein